MGSKPQISMNGISSKKKILAAYILAALVFGVLYMVILPFPASPDENRHFLKIYSVTEGYLLPSDTTMLPDGLDVEDQYELKYEELKTHYGQRADDNNRRRYDLSRTSFYFPLDYLPQTVGFAISKLFTDRVFTIALAGRICGYIFNICMTAAAICIIPFGEMIVFLSVLNPMYMQQAVSLSGDSVVNALAVFITAYILALRAGKVKAVWPLFVIFPILSVCKMFYLPMVFMVFLIPKDVLGSRKKEVLTKAGVIAGSFMCSALWVLAVSKTTLYISDEKTGSNLEYILGDPAGYAVIVKNSILFHGRTWVRQTFGGNLGWISVNVFMPFILIYLMVLIYTALAEKSDLRIKDRVCIFLVDLVIFFVVLTTEYVQWTAYGSDIIQGVQGRYFLPVVPVSFLMLTNNRLKLPRKYLNLAGAFTAAVFNAAALITVFIAFS